MRLHNKAQGARSAISLMAVLLLFVASLGIPLSQHLCGGKVYSQALYGSPAPCSMQPDDQAPGPVSLSPVPCCDDRHELLAASGLENDGPRALAISPDQTMDGSFGVQALAYMPSSQKSLYPLGYKSPPLPSKDRVLVYRVLLI